MQEQGLSFFNKFLFFLFEKKFYQLYFYYNFTCMQYDDNLFVNFEQHFVVSNNNNNNINNCRNNNFDELTNYQNFQNCIVSKWTGMTINTDCADVVFIISLVIARTQIILHFTILTSHYSQYCLLIFINAIISNFLI